MAVNAQGYLQSVCPLYLRPSPMAAAPASPIWFSHKSRSTRAVLCLRIRMNRDQNMNNVPQNPQSLEMWIHKLTKCKTPRKQDDAAIYTNTHCHTHTHTHIRKNTHILDNMTLHFCESERERASYLSPSPMATAPTSLIWFSFKFRCLRVVLCLQSRINHAKNEQTRESGETHQQTHCNSDNTQRQSKHQKKKRKKKRGRVGEIGRRL